MRSYGNGHKRDSGEGGEKNGNGLETGVGVVGGGMHLNIPNELYPYPHRKNNIPALCTDMCTCSPPPHINNNNIAPDSESLWCILELILRNLLQVVKIVLAADGGSNNLAAHACRNDAYAILLFLLDFPWKIIASRSPKFTYMLVFY